MITECDSTASDYVRDAHRSFVITARSSENILDATLDTIAILDHRNGADPKHAAQDWSLLACGIVRGAMDFGADLRAVGEGMMLGAIRSAEPLSEAKTETIKVIAEAGVREAIALGGDFESMAAGLVCGATEGERELAQADESSEGTLTGYQRCGHLMQEALANAVQRTRALTSSASDLMTKRSRVAG